MAIVEGKPLDELMSHPIEGDEWPYYVPLWTLDTTCPKCDQQQVVIGVYVDSWTTPHARAICMNCAWESSDYELPLINEERGKIPLAPVFVQAADEATDALIDEVALGYGDGVD